MRIPTFFLSVFLLSASILAAQNSLPTIYLISTGGTIASKGDTRMNLANYGGPGWQVEVEEFLRDLPEMHEIANVKTETIKPPPDSGGMTFENWFRLVKRINEIYATEPEVVGIVVTHGTNTLEETAFFCNMTVKSDKPVVFVGAQRPWTGISGDGPLNMYNAIRVAIDPASKGRGVMVVLNDQINSARDVTKASAYRLETFQSPEVGFLGMCDPDRIVFYRKPERKHTYQSEFDIDKIESLPPVEILMGYTEASAAPVRAFLEDGVKGIIVDGHGAGSPTGKQTEALKGAIAQGVPVVATTRTGSGRVIQTIRRREAGIIPGDNFYAQKARILLSLALTKTTDPVEIERIFNEY